MSVSQNFRTYILTPEIKELIARYATKPGQHQQWHLACLHPRVRQFQVVSTSIRNIRVQKEGLGEVLTRTSSIWHRTADGVRTRVVLKEW